MQKSLILNLIFIIVANVSLSGQIVQNFTFIDTDGITHDLYGDYLDNGKTVLLKIFFVDCPPCRNLASPLQTLYEEWGEGQNDVQFIELSNRSSDTNANVKGYKDDFNLTFPGAGTDGGSLIALEQFLNGTFGTFFGTPEFVIISPDGSVNYGVGGGSIENTMSALDAAILETGAEKPSEEVLPRSFQIQFEDFFGNPIEEVDLVLASTSSTLEFPIDITNGSITFTNFEEQYPNLTNPVFRARKQDQVDNNVSTSDILVIVRHILNFTPITNTNLLLAADVNGDSTISSIDLLAMQRVILGLLSEFPNVDSYQFPINDIPINVQPGETQLIQFIGIKTGDLNGL